MGNATLLQLAFLGEIDLNFPWEKFPLGPQSVQNTTKYLQKDETDLFPLVSTLAPGAAAGVPIAVSVPPAALAVHDREGAGLGGPWHAPPDLHQSHGQGVHCSQGLPQPVHQQGPARPRSG